jgi:hypothetical protein
VIKRHALKDQALQPKPEPLGAAQVELVEKTDTALNASCPQTGKVSDKIYFCFVFFVATKKMTLLSGNPDGFAFVFVV